MGFSFSNNKYFLNTRDTKEKSPPNRVPSPFVSFVVNFFSFAAGISK
jgi:hypothetical protein